MLLIVLDLFYNKKIIKLQKFQNYIVLKFAFIKLLTVGCCTKIRHFESFQNFRGFFCFHLHIFQNYKGRHFFWAKNFKRSINVSYYKNLSLIDSDDFSRLEI